MLCAKQLGARLGRGLRTHRSITGCSLRLLRAFLLRRRAGDQAGAAALVAVVARVERERRPGSSNGGSSRSPRAEARKARCLPGRAPQQRSDCKLLGLCGTRYPHGVGLAAGCYAPGWIRVQRATGGAGPRATPAAAGGCGRAPPPRVSVAEQLPQQAQPGRPARV